MLQVPKIPTPVPEAELSYVVEDPSPNEGQTTVWTSIQYLETYKII
jgi:hypothetical protein